MDLCWWKGLQEWLDRGWSEAHVETWAQECCFDEILCGKVLEPGNLVFGALVGLLPTAKLCPLLKQHRRILGYEKDSASMEQDGRACGSAYLSAAKRQLLLERWEEVDESCMVVIDWFQEPRKVANVEQLRDRLFCSWADVSETCGVAFVHFALWLVVV